MKESSSIILPGIGGSVSIGPRGMIPFLSNTRAISSSIYITSDIYIFLYRYYRIYDTQKLILWGQNLIQGEGLKEGSYKIVRMNTEL